MSSIVNIAAYKFVTLNDLARRRQELRDLTARLRLKGTILLSEEGINCFVAGGREAIDELLSVLRAEPELADLPVKESVSDRQPFRRMLVRIKREIIAFGVDTVDPRESTSPRITAQQLRQWFAEGRDFALVDVRNDYEVELGTFQNATPIGLRHFRNFPDAVAALPDELRDKPVVTFCTGGIRCEKAGPFLQQAGFREVYQLDGGILKYFEECGGDYYDGSCFVFDQRVALNPQLQETDTQLCFACLSPLTGDDQKSPHYVPPVSCPHCYRTPDEAMDQRIAARQAAIAEATAPLPGSVPWENRRPMNVPGRLDGVTLAEFLRECHTRLGEHDWEAETRAGRLQRQQQPLALTDRVRGGDRLEHVEAEVIEPPVNADIRIVFEDEFLVAVNKPAPLPMHACGRYHRNSLVWILNQVYHPQKLRPLHRLDANTSGLVLLGRTRRVARIIQAQFEAGTVDKVYLAHVRGQPLADAFGADMPVSRQPGPGGTRSVDDDGLPAVTEFTVRERYDDGTSLVEARPLSGRTNQIRLHLAELGLPVVGDPLYGLNRTPDAIRSDGFVAGTLPVEARSMRLHAHSLRFQHPDGRSVHLVASPPAWLAAVTPSTLGPVE